MAEGHKGNEADAPPMVGMEIIMDGCWPSRPCSRGTQGQRGRCPSTPISVVAASGGREVEGGVGITNNESRIRI